MTHERSASQTSIGLLDGCYSAGCNDGVLVTNVAGRTKGTHLAQANCSNCHSIDKVSPSPLPIAPPFRELHGRYPVERLEEALGEGIVTGHQNMPEFRLAPDQIGNFIAFLKSLER